MKTEKSEGTADNLLSYRSVFVFTAAVAIAVAASLLPYFRSDEQRSSFTHRHQARGSLNNNYYHPADEQKRWRGTSKSRSSTPIIYPPPMHTNNRRVVGNSFRSLYHNNIMIVK